MCVAHLQLKLKFIREKIRRLKEIGGCPNEILAWKLIREQMECKLREKQQGKNLHFLSSFTHFLEKLLALKTSALLIQQRMLCMLKGGERGASCKRK